MKCDVLIVGAGLAGCACARLCAQAGLSVVAVDRADLAAKDKLCGGLLTPRAQRVMARLYGPRAEALYRQTHTSMRVLFGDHDHVIDGVCVKGTLRRDLDQFALAAAVEAGARVIDQACMVSLDPRARRCKVESGDGPIEIEYDSLVAADGAASVTRKLLCQEFAAAEPAPAAHSSWLPRFTRPCPAELVPSIEAFVEPSGQMLAGKYNAILRGYGWYIPCGDTANIGVDAAPGTPPAALRAELENFAHQMGVKIDPAAVRGAFIPSGGSVLLQVEGAPGACYLIGDAAGLAAPATGEGIYFALRSAELAARALAGHTAASYRSLMAGEAATLQRQHKMLGTLFDPRIMEKAISFGHHTGLGSGNMARIALKLFASF